MKRMSIIVAASLVSTACAVSTKADDPAVASMNAARGDGGKQSMADGTDASAKAPKGIQTNPTSNEIKPSPWQPPAEVDPILPPVEGSEPK